MTVEAAVESMQFRPLLVLSTHEVNRSTREGALQ
jgi:hypothetical protein